MKKVAIIILIAVLALGVLGTAYAVWGQNLTITGTVDTAKFAVAFDEATKAPVVFSGSTNLTVDNTSAPYAFAVNLTNALPGDGGVVNYQIDNTGTTPVNAQLQYSTDNTTWNPWDGTEKDVISNTTVKVAVTGTVPSSTIATAGTAAGSITIAVTGSSTSGTVNAVGTTHFWVRVVATAGS